MGTISEKLTYLNETKQKLKQAINNIGGEVTDETTFREYANQLQNVYDNLPKTEYQEGTEITLSNTLKGKLDFEDGIVGIGDTKQTQYEGYNLCEAKMPTTTASQGITFTNNGDGTYTVSGTNSSENSVTFRINQSTQIGGDNLQNYEDGTYTLDLGIANANMGISLMQNQTWTTYLGTGYGTRLVSRAITNATNTFIYVAVKANASFSTPVTIKPMLVRGSYTESTMPNFEQYTGGQASPNPSYPQEIKYVRGKNLFETKQLTEETKNGITFTPVYENGLLKYINVNGTATAVASYWLQDGNTEQASTYPNKLSAGTYRLSDFYESSSYYRAIYFRYTTDNSTFTTINSYATPNITFSEDVKWMAFIRIASGETLNNAKFYPQLEKGTTSTPYLPYNTIEEVVSGKNKFNIGTSLDDWFQTNNNGTKIGSYTINTTTATILNNTLTIDTYNNAGYNWISKWLELEKNTDYIISGTNTQSLRIVGFDSNALTTQGTLIVNKNSNLSEHTKTFNSGDYKYYCLSFYPDTAGKYFENIQIEQGSTATTYEPYITPTSYQLSLGDIELNAIGNYKDELIYDVDEDKVYKNEKIKEIILNGAETFNAQPTYIAQGRFDIVYDDILLGSATNNPVISTHFKSKFAVEDGAIFLSGVQREICLCNFSYVNDLQGFKTWLSNNTPKVCCALQTPTLTELTDETLHTQVKALYNAHSNNGTTIITSNGNLPMIIKCRGLKGE